MLSRRHLPFVGLATCFLLVAWPSDSSQAAPRAATPRSAAHRAAAPRAAASRAAVARPARAKKAWLGTALVPLGQVDRKQRGVPRYGGVLVERVLGDSPAGRTGILAGDVIMRLDDKYVYQPEEVIRRVETTPIGRSVKIDVIRNGGWLTAAVRLTPRPSYVPSVSAAPSAPPQPTRARPEPAPGAEAPARVDRPRAHPAAAAAARAPEAISPGLTQAALTKRLGALEREVRMLRKVILAQQKRCRP